jgi:hypothetical protein
MKTLKFATACLLGAAVVLIDTPSFITSMLVDGVGVVGILWLLNPFGQEA